jgi:hypothetical protein
MIATLIASKLICSRLSNKAHVKDYKTFLEFVLYRGLHPKHAKPAKVITPGFMKHLASGASVNDELKNDMKHTVLLCRLHLG